MLIIPAIDIKDGCVVRLFQGRINKKIYSYDPLKTAKHWLRQGAELIHIVDLDGAATGTPKNLPVIKEIVKSVDVPVQFGGGVRDIELLRRLLSFGVERVVLGTKAAEDKAFLAKARRRFQDKVIVSIDARSGRVLINGWQSSSKGTDALRFALALKELGFRQLIYTDTLRDGALKGPNIKGIRRLLKETKMNIIASGGISSLHDIGRLRPLERYGLSGVIIGKALYEGRFTLIQASRSS